MSAESDLRDRVVASSVSLALDGVTGPQSLLDVDRVQRIGDFYRTVLDLAEWITDSGLARILRGFPGAHEVDEPDAVVFTPDTNILPEDGCLA